MTSNNSELIYRCLACDTARTDRDVPCELCGARADPHSVEGEHTVTYTPDQLHTRITRVAAETVAARLRARAEVHRAEAARLDGLTRPTVLGPVAPNNPRSAWHRDEAEALERLAARELGTAKAGEPGE